jgi:hypothetical protein
MLPFSLNQRLLCLALFSDDEWNERRLFVLEFNEPAVRSFSIIIFFDMLMLINGFILGCLRGHEWNFVNKCENLDGLMGIV